MHRQAVVGNAAGHIVMDWALCLMFVFNNVLFAQRKEFYNYKLRGY